MLNTLQNAQKKLPWFFVKCLLDVCCYSVIYVIKLMVLSKAYFILSYYMSFHVSGVHSTGNADHSVEPVVRQPR